jgi:hypothetical protein
VVLDDDVDVVLRAELAQAPQAVGRQRRCSSYEPLLCGVDADRVAAEELRGFDPAVMVLDRLRPRRGVGIAQVPFAVAHDEQALHAVVLGPLLHLTQVRRVLRLVLEELVDVLDGLDVELLACADGEVEVVHLLRAERLVKRPLCERDAESRLPLGEEREPAAAAPARVPSVFRKSRRSRA